MTAHRFADYRCGAIVCAAFWFAACGALLGEEGMVGMLPPLGIKMRSGLTVEVDSRGVSSNGYRPVRVKVSNTPARNKPPVPVTADRRLRVVLKPTGRGHLGSVATSQVIEIPEKQSFAEATIAVPHAGDWYQMEVEVYEGGDKLEDVSGAISRTFFGWAYMSETRPASLFIDYDVPDRNTRDAIVAKGRNKAVTPADSTTLPDFRNFAATAGYYDSSSNPAQEIGKGDVARLSDAAILFDAAKFGQVQCLPPAEMPGRWIELSCFDLAFISVDDLAKMAEQDAPQHRALLDWLHGGPTLVVYGVGHDFSRLAQVEKLLELEAIPLEGDKELPFRGWSPAKKSDLQRGRVVSDPQGVYGRAYRPPGSSTQTSTNLNSPSAPLDASRPPFVARPANLGWSIAIASDDPFPGTVGDWNWVLNSIPLEREQWMKRHGMSYQTFNHDFWNWYVPGVGAAPVFGFLALATLFAIVIGPVNYLLLGRIQRLYLLLVTVPAGAAVVTLCLFAYATLSDGLGVKARIRSFSLLDQTTGRTVSWSRQSYYASLVPSQGLKYPPDTVVWPLEEVPNPNQYRSSGHRLYWEGDGQRLGSGYIWSRTLTQLIVIRAAKSASRLNVAEPPGGAPPRVTSELGNIQRLMLRNRQGSYFRADEELKSGEGATLKPMTEQEACELISQTILKHQLAFPDGYDSVAEARRVESRWMYYMSGSGSFGLSQESGILERSLTDLKAGSGHVLAPRTYFAVVENNADVPLGIAAAHQKDSFHVIVGRW